MNDAKKQEILSSLKVTENTKKFISNMEPNFGNLIKNTKKKDVNEPDFIGWARLSNGQIISITGNVRAVEGKAPIVPLKVVEVPGEMIGEDEVTIASVPEYMSDVDDFLS